MYLVRTFLTPFLSVQLEEISVQFNDIQTGRYKLATEVLKTLAGSEKAVWYRQGKRGDGGAGTGTRRHCWKQI